jgi:hypothetical protein
MLALVDRDREPRVLALARQHFDFSRQRDHAVVELDAFAQPLDLLRAHLAMHLDVIGLRHVARRREELRGELAVVRQQQHALGVEIEAADRLHGYWQVRQVVHHRHATAIVGDCRDAGLRLVEQDVELVEWIDRFAVDRHAIVLGIDLAAERRHHFAVHGHATGRDEVFSFASRCDASRSQITLQSYRRRHGGQSVGGSSVESSESDADTSSFAAISPVVAVEPASDASISALSTTDP